MVRRSRWLSWYSAVAQWLERGGSVVRARWISGYSAAAQWLEGGGSVVRRARWLNG